MAMPARKVPTEADVARDTRAPREAAASLATMITGFMAARAVHVAARLGIADLIGTGSTTAEALARATDSHLTSLIRLLRALVVLGLLEETEPGRFALTDIGAALRAGTPGSLRHVALLFGGDAHWRVWGDLLHSVMTGETGYRHLFGVGAFEYRAGRPEEAAVFNAAMAELTSQIAGGIVEVYDFSRFETIVDVGGGHGTLLAVIVTATPGLRGVVFDTPSGAAGAEGYLRSAGIADRTHVVEGDFFVSVPAGHDAYILKSIIHDWDDARSVTILDNCRRAMRPGGKVLVVERLMPARLEPSAAHRRTVLSDLNMLVAPGGRERTEDEYRALFAAAGLTLTRIVSSPESPDFWVIEAEAA